jgi:hypothetical protein
MAKNDGGTAFPTTSCGAAISDGMSLRDHFAGQAMQALAHDILIDQEKENMLMKSGIEPGQFMNFLANMAYNMADAMIERRGQ